MMSKKNRTRQQMEEEMRQLRKVFMTVRLMKADEVQGGKKGSAPCYAQWRRSRPCENCVARQALEKNTRKTRLEYFGQELYEITASCVQVDGQLCVLELTRKIDRSVLLDPENGERLLNSITDEREKRYRDPLTGAYNRTYYDENYRYRSITAGVAMLDMDDLKFSNDVYGSGAGNSVLETAVSTIRRGLSEKDRLAVIVFDKAHNLIRKGFPAGFAEVDMNVKGRAADVLHKGGFGGQRGSGCGGAGLAGFIAHRLSFP